MPSDDELSTSADEGAYGQAPSPGGGYGSTGVQRPPIAYYNNQTGGVVVTPPKSLFVNFGKDMDKVLQVGPALPGMGRCPDCSPDHSTGSSGARLWSGQDPTCTALHTRARP